MTEKNNENLLYAISTLGDVLESRDFSIRVKDSMIADRDAEIKDLKNRIASEHGREEEYESTIRIQKEYIANLEAKIYDLEERIAIMTETEVEEAAHDFPMSTDAPIQPMWDITPPVEVTEVTNISKVIMEEDAE